MTHPRTLVTALTTVGNEDDARRVARTLVEERLAACVNRLPVQSTYRWEGKVEDDAEYLLVIKTAGDLLERLERRVGELSSYDVPEFVVLAVSATSDSYLKWLLESCPPASG